MSRDADRAALIRGIKDLLVDGIEVVSVIVTIPQQMPPLSLGDNQSTESTAVPGWNSAYLSNRIVLWPSPGQKQ